MHDEAIGMTEIGRTLSIRVEHGEDHERVRIVGELDMASAGALEREISGIEDGAESDRLVVDLGGLRYVDSSGLDALINITSSARRRRFRLEMTPGHEGLQRVFQLTGLDRVLPFSGGDEPLSNTPASG